MPSRCLAPVLIWILHLDHTTLGICVRVLLAADVVGMVFVRNPGSVCATKVISERTVRTWNAFVPTPLNRLKCAVGTEAASLPVCAHVILGGLLRTARNQIAQGVLLLVR
eukprot:Rmarinus@m.2407